MIAFGSSDADDEDVERQRVAQYGVSVPDAADRDRMTPSG